MILATLLLPLLAATPAVPATGAPEAGVTPPPTAEADSQAAQENAGTPTVVDEPIVPWWEAGVVATDTGTAADNPFYMPDLAAEQGTDTDWLMDLINIVTVIFTVIVLAALIYFAIRYRQRGDTPREGKGTSHSTTLEITWTLIPTMIVLVIFSYGFKGYLNQQIAPPNAIQIDVRGYRWAWAFSYPDAAGGIDSVLYVPLNEAVELTMNSDDVIHSLYIPAFRAKKDVVPGRYNKMWFRPTELGTYELFCSEYCGTSHSRMGTKVVVLSYEDWEAKMDEIADPYTRINYKTGEKEEVPFAEVGMQYHQNLCVSCHSVDGSVGTGPSWLGIYGQPRAGSTQGVVNEEYIAESIWYPGRYLVEGWGNAMPAFASTLSEKDLKAIAAYIATLSDGYKVDADGTIYGPGESTSLGGPETEGDAQ